MLKGEKDVSHGYIILQLLHIGQYGGVDFPWFTKSNHFTKNHLLSYFKNDNKLLRFLPDDIKKDCINRKYLLNVSWIFIFQILFNVRRDIYNKLYAEYKIIKNSRETQNWNGYFVNVANGVSDTIQRYTSVER